MPRCSCSSAWNEGFGGCFQMAELVVGEMESRRACLEGKDDVDLNDRVENMLAGYIGC